MGYAAVEQNDAAPKASLVMDSERICASLDDVYNRLGKIGDQLHGSRPNEVKSDKPPAPNGSVRLHIDRAHRMLCSIHEELGRIENNL